MIVQPYINFIQPDAGGNIKPVSKGKVYIGNEGLDPKLGGNPIYYRDNQGVEKEISNPIYLNMTGVAVAGPNDSTTISPYTKKAISILIEDKDGNEVYSKLVDVSEFLSRYQVLQMTQIYMAENTTDMLQGKTSGGDVITPEVGQYWSVLGVNYRRISDLNSLSSFRIETREVEYSNLLEALSEQAVLQVGNFVSIAGHNTPGDGGAARFKVVLSSEEIGIPNNSGTIKLKRIEGQEQWKAQYAGSLPKFIAHRGAAGYTEKNLYFVPENTIYSARRSAEAGFWGLESDAKVTADGQIAVFHDTTVDRTITGQTGPVSSFTMSQLKSFDAGSYVSNIYTNARVMDYNEWFASCRKFSLVPCAEISVAMTDAQVDKFIADCLQYYPDGVGVFLQSTNLETLQKIRAKNANITLYRSFSYGSVPDVALFDDMYALGNAGVHFSGGALNSDSSIVQAAKDRGLCTSYAIANTAELVQTARDLGIHRIMTDFILGDY